MSGIWQKMERDRALTPEFRACIERVYGERGRKALAAVDAGQVKRYLDFFVVVATATSTSSRTTSAPAAISSSGEESAGTYLRCA